MRYELFQNTTFQHAKCFQLSRKNGAAKSLQHVHIQINISQFCWHIEVLLMLMIWIMMTMMTMNCFYFIWFTNERILALFSAGMLVRDIHYHNSSAGREQDTNLHGN